MKTGIKVRYEGNPLWQVGYMIERVSEKYKDIRIWGEQIIEKFVGYMLIPAASMLEARTLALEKAMIYQKPGYVNLHAKPINTHEWRGESNSAEAANRAYQMYKQNGLQD